MLDWQRVLGMPGPQQGSRSSPSPSAGGGGFVGFFIPYFPGLREAPGESLNLLPGKRMNKASPVVGSRRRPLRGRSTWPEKSELGRA